MGTRSNLAAGLILAGLATASPAGGSELLVLPDGTGQFPTIEAAISAARDGDVILLGDGVFRGAANHNLSYLGKAIAIRSRSGNADACRIDCLSNDPGPQRAFTFERGEGPKSRLENVSLWNGRADLVGEPGGAILIRQGSSPLIADCIFYGNLAVHGGAIHIEGESAPSIEGCRFLYNGAEEFGGAIQVNGQGYVTVADCIFWRNHASWGGALGCDYSIVLDRGNTYAENRSFDTGVIGSYGGSVVMEGTIVAFSEDGPAIEHESGTVWLFCCDLYGNEGGDWIGWLAQQLGVEGNICADPRFCDLPAGNVDLHAGSPCIAPLNETTTEGCGWIGAGRVGCGPLDGGEGTAAIATPSSGPGGLALRGPNPLRPGDRLAWSLPGAPGQSAGMLAVYDAAGRRVRSLELGDGSVIWDGRGQDGQPLARGVYFFGLPCDGRHSAVRAFLLP